MPKSFTENERAFIIRRLLEETEACLSLYGIRKTTVDEIVKRVNIPKGTFYLFYESKERLIFDVIMQFHDRIQQTLLAEIAELEEKINPHTLTESFFGLYKSLEGSFLPKLIADGELAFFMGKLPPELAAMHAQDDDVRVGELISLLPGLDERNIPVFSAALRGIFLSLLFKKELGEAVFDGALRLMIRGLVIQMFEPPVHTEQTESSGGAL